MKVMPMHGSSAPQIFLAMSSVVFCVATTSGAVSVSEPGILVKLWAGVIWAAAAAAALAASSS